MEIAKRDEPGRRVYVIKQNIDSSSMREFELELTEFCSAGEKDVVVDLGAVSRLDSLALALFLKAKNLLSEKGKKFRLTNLSDSVRRIIEIASLETILLEKDER